MTKENAIENIIDAERYAIETACEALSGYGVSIRKNIAELVASLCNVDVDAMLSDNKNTMPSQARWFYWMCLKKIFNESCNSISRNSCESMIWSVSSVANGLSQISSLISQNNIWAKRWSIIKSVIEEIRK